MGAPRSGARRSRNALRIGVGCRPAAPRSRSSPSATTWSYRWKVARASSPTQRRLPIVDVIAPPERLAMLRILTGAFALACVLIRLPVRRRVRHRVAVRDPRAGLRDRDARPRVLSRLVGSAAALREPDGAVSRDPRVGAVSRHLVARRPTGCEHVPLRCRGVDRLRVADRTLFASARGHLRDCRYRQTSLRRSRSWAVVSVRDG